MQFRQNGQRDERRRRVLRDELSTPPASAEDASRTAGGRDSDTKVPSRGYSAAVSVESQPPISCLIATRPWTLSVLLLAALAIIAGLQAAYTNVFLGAGLPPELTSALDVTARGSLAAWFSSVLLSMAAVNAALVYWLRSHKLDDYRGRYRVWLWTALGLALAAINSSTGLHAIVGYLIADRFETPWLNNPSINGLVALSLVFGSLAVRLAFEIWASRLARFWSMLAATGYVTSILVRTDLIVIDSAILTTMADSTAILVANLAVAFTVASYCRYVHLESQGALKPRRQRKSVQAAASARKETKSKTVQQPTKVSTGTPATSGDDPPAKKTLRAAKINSKSIRCDSAHQSQGEPRTANAASNETNAAVMANQPPMNTPESADDDISDYDPETGERLSKSERRRLRKQMRRQKKASSG